jgi:phage host-nuclease inhibitor protein Gam
MTKRIKAISEIRSRAEFDGIVESIVTMQLAKERLEGRRDAKLLAIRDEFDPDITDLREKMETAVLRAEKYAATHREELLPAKRKSSETSFAFFGFRTGNPTLVLLNRTWTWKKVLEAIKEHWAPKDAARVIVVKEAVDKDVLKQSYSPEELAGIGTRVEQHETFFIDPKRDPADPQRLAVPVEDRRAA